MADVEIPASELSAADAYRLMTDLVAPRPIAWVSTIDEEGRGNLAPFSYYQAVCSRPPMITLAIASGPEGRPKDTLANILATHELVVSHVHVEQAATMNATSMELAHDVSEWEMCAVAPAPSLRVRPPRVASSHASLECVLRHALPLGGLSALGGAPSTTLVIAEVLHFHVHEGLVRRDPRGRLLPISPAALGALGRLGGMAYTTTERHFELPRPPGAPRRKDP
ncbi:MAG: flavin reductase family protein [Nannocystis sp.]|nr:flavin reductase family protein [Nannocystis sp.]